MASMKGANKNGVSRGVFRPCERLGQSHAGSGLFMQGQTYDDSETDKDEGPGCTRRREVSRRGTQRSDSEGGTHSYRRASAQSARPRVRSSCGRP